MIFPDSPEGHLEIEHQLDPDLHDDAFRTCCDLTDLARIMLQSIYAMDLAEKQSARDAAFIPSVRM